MKPSSIHFIKVYKNRLFDNTNKNRLSAKLFNNNIIIRAPKNIYNNTGGISRYDLRIATLNL